MAGSGGIRGKDADTHIPTSEPFRVRSTVEVEAGGGDPTDLISPQNQFFMKKEWRRRRDSFPEFL